MTDPTKLAELLESANSRLEKPGDVRFFTFEIETEDFALVAAALRLANESTLSWYRDDGRVFMDVDEETFDAFMAAMEGT